MRWSIVGVAVNVVMPVALDDVDDARGVELLEHEELIAGRACCCSVANALMWYIGASTRIRCGRVTGMNALGDRECPSSG